VALRRVTVPRTPEGLLPPDSKEINAVISALLRASTLSIKIVVAAVDEALLSLILPLPGSASAVAPLNV